jgi:hypothetical protein
MYRNEEDGLILVSGTLSAFHAKPETVELENAMEKGVCGRLLQYEIPDRASAVGSEGRRFYSSICESEQRVLSVNLGQRGPGT